MHRCLQMTPKSTPPSTQSQDDVKNLQADMDKLLQWSRTWLLKFNASKFKVMHMGYSNPGGSYMMDGVTLEEIEQEKDLGVYITNDCKHSTQCTKAAAEDHDSLFELSKECSSILTKKHSSSSIQDIHTTLGVLCSSLEPTNEKGHKLGLPWKKFRGGQQSWSQN